MNRQVFTPQDAALTTNYLGFVYRTLLADGHQSDRLLKATGLTEDNLSDPGFRCTFKQHKALCLNTMEETGDPHLGLRLGTVFNPLNIGLPVSAAMSSDNFSIALDVLQKYLCINFPIVSFSVLTEEEKLVLRWQTTIYVGEIEYFVLGAAVTAFERLFRLMLKEERVCEYAEFATPQPPGSEEIGDFLDFPVYFDGPFTKLVLPIRYLSVPNADADPLIHQRSLRLCQKQLAFSDPSNFARTFKRWTGVSPHEFSETKAVFVGSFNLDPLRQISTRRRGCI